MFLLQGAYHNPTNQDKDLFWHSQSGAEPNPILTRLFPALFTRYMFLLRAAYHALANQNIDVFYKTQPNRVLTHVTFPALFTPVASFYFEL